MNAQQTFYKVKKMQITGVLLFYLFTFLPLQAQRSPVGIISVQDSTKSVQFGLITSVAVSQMKGLQVGGFNNMSAAPVNGVQFSGFSNIAMGTDRGLQAASLFNISAGEMKGMQLAITNFTDTLSGFQLGLFNRSLRQPKGWQVGVVNISTDSTAHQLGLFNILPTTTIDYMLFGGNANKGNIAVRLRDEHVYNILGLGTHYMGLDKKFSGSVFYRLGLYKQLSPRWSVSGDIGFAHVETFQEHTSGPERLYSLQARLNADYQISKRIGAFATVGWGDTRYYHHSTPYRSRPIIEAGLTLRQQHRMRTAPVLRHSNDPELGDSLAQWPYGKHPWRAVAEMTGVNVFVHCFDRWATNEVFAQTTMRSIRHNLKNGFVWDNDLFTTNMFMHPYHGNLYFNSARSNGLTFWESAPFALGGSAMWELFGETEPPAINDIMATSMGGIAIGEVTHRLSNAVLDDGQCGWPRFWREALGTLINPIKGLNRIISGQAWRVRSTQNKYHDWKRFPIHFMFSVGDRYLADDGSLFRGEHNPYTTLRMEYGDVMNEGENNKPYDYFEMQASFGLSDNQPFINRLHMLGRIWSTPMFDYKGIEAEFGIYQHFNYYDSKPVKDGSDLTPYRISEAASVGPGFVVQLPQTGALNLLEQRIFLSGILLGGTKSDYFNVIERDYNMGSGYSVKSKTHLELKNFGRFITNVSFFHLFTLRGYERYSDAELAEFRDGVRDLHYLNVQGDRSIARLLVINPVAEIDLGRNWAFTIDSSFFLRSTRYKYHDNVKANTFEIKAGLTYHL